MGVQFFQPTELIFTIVPPLCLLMRGNTAFIILITPKKLVSNCSLNSLIESCSTGPSNTYPALLTNTSSLSCSCSILPIASLTDLSLLTSS